MRAFHLVLVSAGVGLFGCQGTIGEPESGKLQGTESGGSVTGVGTTTGQGPGTTGSGASTTGGSGSGGAGPGMPLDCSKASVGVAPMRRLTRSEYASSVQALLGVAAPVDSLPADERVGAFPSNLAPVATLDVENYVDAAATVASAAVANLTMLTGGCDRAALGDAACADRFIATFGVRVHRRPLDATETSAYKALYTDRANGDFANGIRVVVQAMLSSPYFLYHLESRATGASALEAAPLDGYTRAARLSYLLWSSTPDDALLDAAKAGSLEQAAGVRAQAQRMLTDARARSAVATFHLDWLGIDGVDAMTKDPTLYPQFTPALARAMKDETARFATYVLFDSDRKLDTLLTAPYSFPSGPLADLYGIKNAPTNPSAPVPLDPAQRAGILTQPGFLAAHSHENQSSPVQRGKAVREFLLCDPPPPPPPTVNAVAPDPKPGATTRERFAEHEKEPACGACHSLIDGIGFGFEHYDAIGRYRTDDGGRPVDASGHVVGTQDADGSFDGAVDLARRLASSEQVKACVAEKWFEFAVGRAPSAADACSLQAARQAMDAAGGDLRELVLALVTSDSFILARKP
jgi:hypothetical protein